MKFNLKGNINYSAVIVKIEKLIPLENCDNIQHAQILGNSVIVSKDCKIGDVGIYFPVECSISKDFLKVNNLYRDTTLNADTTKKGFFELNGRVRCVKFRGNKSEGFFIPIDSIYFMINEFMPYSTNIKKLELEIGTQFDYIDDNKICEKYIIRNKQPGMSGSKKGRKAKISKIIPGQFVFHKDTEMIKRNIDRIFLDDLLQITAKFHGCSGISSKILCKRKLSIFEKLLLLLKVKIQTTEYDMIYSSRKVIKNEDINNKQHYYSEDIWGRANNVLSEYIDAGMSLYYEIVGYLSDGKMIQKDYDYGCEQGKFDIYIYRITTISAVGIVHEFSARQVQQWCKQKGLKPVIELYYGLAKDLYKEINTEDLTLWREQFLEKLANDKNFHMEENCVYNKNIVPTEGIVIRKESLGIESWKLKCNAFYLRETKLLDEQVEDIEENQTEENV